MKNTQQSIKFVVGSCPYRAQRLGITTGRIRLDLALERVASPSAQFNQEDADNFRQHPDHLPASLRGCRLITHCKNPLGSNYYLYVSVHQDGTVTYDWHEANRQCSPNSTFVLMRDK